MPALYKLYMSVESRQSEEGGTFIRIYILTVVSVIHELANLCYADREKKC